MALTATETRINELFEELVPPQGKADTVAGEIIRAVCRLHYRNWNDGDHGCRLRERNLQPGSAVPRQAREPRDGDCDL